MPLQWEYRLVELDLDSPRAPQALNNAGREGWEAVTASTRGTNHHFVVLLKRMRQPKDDEERIIPRRKRTLAS